MGLFVCELYCFCFRVIDFVFNLNQYFVYVFSGYEGGQSMEVYLQKFIIIIEGKKKKIFKVVGFFYNGFLGLSLFSNENILLN